MGRSKGKFMGKNKSNGNGKGRFTPSTLIFRKLTLPPLGTFLS